MFMDHIDWFSTTPPPPPSSPYKRSLQHLMSLSVLGLALALARFAPRGRKQAIIHG